MMPKRIIDGEGLWRSDKLAEITPTWIKAEFANLIPLARANGSFECHPRLIWSQVYAFNRPEITIENVTEIVAELERVKLLFRWIDQSGKQWGYWIGIEKVGRLPAKSRLAGGHEVLGAEPPQDKLSQFLGVESVGQPLASQRSTNGCLGFGLSNGFGYGFDAEPFVRQIQKAWPFKDTATGTERLLFEAFSKDAEENGTSLEEATKEGTAKLLEIAKVIASRPKTDWQFYRLASIANARSYHNSPETFSTPGVKPKSQTPVITGSAATEFERKLAADREVTQ